jgi:general secretion pathway protein F
MSLFTFDAVDARGRRQRGDIEADSERAARQQLKNRQLMVRSLAPAVERAMRHGEKGGRKKLSASETALFLDQLATLCAAGMRLTEALDSIAGGMDSRNGRRVIAALRQSVLEGGSLAESLRGQHFDEVICNMVAAGEEAGQLEAVAMRLSELLSHRQQLRQDLLSATLYPSIILGFGFLVMMFLLAVVVPQVVSVFQRSGASLPWLTQVVIALSGFMQHDGLWLLVGIAAVAVSWKLAMRKQALRARRDAWLLRLPVVASLLARIETSRFSRTLGMLLGGGVAVLPAMHIANQSWSLIPLRKLGEQAREALREGGDLAEALARERMIPHLAIRLIAVGEQSGTLDTMLLRVADQYESEVSRGLKRLLTIAEPLLVMLMAVCVGALAMAILLPIAEMNELVH